MQTNADPPVNKPQYTKEDFIRTEETIDKLLQIEMLLSLSYFLEAGKDPEAYKLITVAQMMDQQTNQYINHLYDEAFKTNPQ